MILLFIILLIYITILIAIYKNIKNNDHMYKCIDGIYKNRIASLEEWRKIAYNTIDKKDKINKLRFKYLDESDVLGYIYMKTGIDLLKME